MITHLHAKCVHTVEGVVVTGKDVERRVAGVVFRDVVATTVVRVVDSLIIRGIIRVTGVNVGRRREVPTKATANECVLERTHIEGHGGDYTVGCILVLVLIHSEQRVQEVAVGVIFRIAHVAAVLSHVVSHVVEVRPDVSAIERTAGAAQHLLVGLVSILHATFEVSPSANLCLAGNREVLTAEVGGLNHTFLLDERSRSTHAHAVVTGFNRHVVTLHKTGLDDSLHVVVIGGVGWISTSVVVGVVPVGGAVSTVGITVLHFRPTVSLRPRELVAVADARFALATLLGGDDDGTVRSVGTVKSGSGSALEHCHALDILGVDVVTTRREVAVANRNNVGNGEARTRVESGVVHWNTVDNVERLVVARN